MFTFVTGVSQLFFYLILVHQKLGDIKKNHWSQTNSHLPGVSRMDVAISFAVFLAQLAAGPLAGHLITFSEEPRLVQLPKTEDLAELYRFTQGGIQRSELK